MAYPNVPILGYTSSGEPVYTTPPVAPAVATPRLQASSQPASQSEKVISQPMLFVSGQKEAEEYLAGSEPVVLWDKTEDSNLIFIKTKDDMTILRYEDVTEEFIKTEKALDADDVRKIIRDELNEYFKDNRNYKRRKNDEHVPEVRKETNVSTAESAV